MPHALFAMAAFVLTPAQCPQCPTPTPTPTMSPRMTPAPIVAPAQPAKIDKKIADACVRTSHALAQPGGGSITQHGSGTVIRREKGRYYVLACHHAVSHQGDMTGKLLVHTRDGKEHAARVVCYCPVRDLSLLVVTGEAPGCARLAKSEEYKPGLRVMKYGYPGSGARPLVVTAGAMLPATTNPQGYRDVVSPLSTVPVQGGDSGCGLFREDGRLIGVVHSGVPSGTAAAHLREIRKVLETAKLDVEE